MVVFQKFKEKTKRWKKAPPPLKYQHVTCFNQHNTWVDLHTP